MTLSVVDTNGAPDPCGRKALIGMPQMAFGGLSENWLMKELADMHWAMICHGLGTKSNALADSSNNRLYASVVRVRLESSAPMQRFEENETLDFGARMVRFGSTMFFSDILLRCSHKEANASLMTVFVARQKDNRHLTKSTPSNLENSKVEVAAAMPQFGQEYLRVKNGPQDTLQANSDLALRLGGQGFERINRRLYATDYVINPYHDLNGVNLLYFAAYPQINDICEREYFHRLRDKFQIKGDWALAASTIARDVFYFGNCDIEDGISFVLNSCDFVPDRKVKTSSSLYRKSDGRLIAHVFTVKQLAGTG